MKTILRQEKKLARILQSQVLKSLNDEKIIDLIKKQKPFRNAKTILIYMPIKGEVDLTPLFSLKNKEKIYCLPKIKRTSFDAFVIEKQLPTLTNKYNIPEPAAGSKKITPDHLDLIFVPGVCFDENGHRIGFGKGYYDRYLKQTNAYKIGIAYEFQMVKNMPWHEHDVPMDMIITEKRVIKIK